MKTIYIVDDNDSDLRTAQLTVSKFYRSFALPSASRMFKMVEKIIPDLIILNIEMSEMDGFTVLAKLKENERTAMIPVMFLTETIDDRIEALGFKLGAVDVIQKPFSTTVFLNRIETHINIGTLIKKRTEKVEQLQKDIVNIMADIVESRDKIKKGHVERTSMYLKIMLDEMTKKGIYADEISTWRPNTVISSVRLHDIGKIRISDLILDKQDDLTSEEIKIVREHPSNGEMIISQIVKRTGKGPFLHHARLFAGYHHERWDGKGYPYGLSGQEIPLQGRLLSIIDVYDKLISTHSHKESCAHDLAVEKIKNDSGTHFDPQLVKVFLAVANDLWVESVRINTDLHKEK